jgi:hypothetical protein
MNLATIEIDKDKAKEAFQSYREAVRERHDAEDEQMMRAYREAAKGSPLIRLSEAMAAGGATTMRYDRKSVRVPRLAVARAHVQFAWTNGISPEGRFRIQGKQEIAHNNTFDVLSFGQGTFPESEERLAWSWGGAALRAMAPNVPPPLRPKHALSNYYLLWEAEWTPAPVPPGDPALLKRLGGDLYAVLAVWDLTEIERAVLAGRRP